MAILDGDEAPDPDVTTGSLPVVRGRPARATVPAHGTNTSARFVCVAGVDIGRVFPIGTEPVIVGRTSLATASLQATDVSRRHARVFGNDDRLFVEDLGSANGTFLNGAPVTSATPIVVGDRLQLGDSTILVLTYRDELEARMRELQKLEAMEQAVAGLAHDFGNALTVIMSGLDYATERGPGAADFVEVMADIRNAAAGASALAKKLLHFRQRDQIAQELIALAPLVDETVAMARRVAPPSISFQAVIVRAIHLRGSRDELQQVLLNLLLNARDAMPHGGTVSITASVVRLPRVDAAVHHLRGGGDYVELVVADTGTGMSEATLARAFEPFFTTKAPGEGTGLGLSMVHNIIRRYGGAIEVESIPDRGTTFRIWLPSAAA